MGLLVASTSINMIANVGFYPFAPPFVITEDEVAELVRIARAAVDDVAAELRDEL